MSNMWKIFCSKWILEETLHDGTFLSRCPFQHRVFFMHFKDTGIICIFVDPSVSTDFC